MVDVFSSATALLEALEAEQISSVELTEMFLEQIERCNPTVNAVVTQNPERAIDAARLADERRGRGERAPLLGLPVTIKDSIDVAGWPSTNGLPANIGRMATVSAPAAAALLDAGAVLLGKTNVPAGGGDWQANNKLFGRTNNPWNPERTSGGSTAGAAAVACGMSPLELGSDIGGSVRIPAAFCGVFAHKPSETLVPKSVRPNAAVSMTVQGPITAYASDLDLVMPLLAAPAVGEDVAWSVHLPAPRAEHLTDLRVAVLPPLPWLPVETEIQAALERVAGLLRSADAQVERALPAELGDGLAFYETYLALLNAIVTRNLPDDVRVRSVAALLANGDSISSAKARGMQATAGEYIAWHDERERFRAAFREFFRSYDVLLAPVTVCVAYPHETRRWLDRRLNIDGTEVLYDLLSVHASLATFTGQPATTFPVGLNSAGLPIGLQAIGPYLEDLTPIRLASLFEREFGGVVRPPLAEANSSVPS
jgi:amidase